MFRGEEVRKEGRLCGEGLRNWLYWGNVGVGLGLGVEEEMEGSFGEKKEGREAEWERST